MRSRLLLPLLLLVVPGAAAAQEGFLFGLPRATVSVRFGYARPALGGELFRTMTDRLTLGAADFGTEAAAADLWFRVTPHLDLGAGVAWMESTVRSESRDWTYGEDQDGDGELDPIEQTTTLRRVPLSLLARVYPLARGESLSDYAWVPARLTPFLGGGVGVLWHRLEQYGDFVDESEDPPSIFESRYESAGPSLAAHALAGAEYWVTPRVGVTAEGRYTWASGTPDDQFDFDTVDLSGWQVTAGVAFRF